MVRPAMGASAHKFARACTEIPQFWERLGDAFTAIDKITPMYLKLNHSPQLRRHEI